MANKIQFTKDQEKAIKTRGQNILVAAAAGSGKTRVLVERIIAQVRSGELSLDHILVLTFTKAAASEMRERIEAALNEEIRAIVEKGGSLQEVGALERQRILLTGADISTFHSFCQRLIQAHIDATDIPPTFRIASEQEIRLLKSDVVEQLLEQEYEKAATGDTDGFLAFSDAYGGIKGDDEKLQTEILALHTFSLSQPSPETWLCAQGQQSNDTPYWERSGFQVLSDELRSSLLQVCADYEAAIALLMEDNNLRPAAKKCLDVLKQNLGIYTELQEALETFLSAEEDRAWEHFLTEAAAAKKAKKNIPRKAVEEYDSEIGARLKELTEKIHAGWETCIAQLPATAEELRGTENRANAEIRQYARLTMAFHSAFQREKLARGILDFSDLEHTALMLLCRNPERLQTDSTISDPTEIADELRAHYDAIMVDEYQDTNGLQEGILRQIAHGHNRFIVGDVKQSIYRFRLADPTLFQNTYQAYRSGSAEGALVTMSENFRSRAEVLEPINEIFTQVMTKSAVEIAYDTSARLNPGRSFEEITEGKSLASPLEINLLRADYSTGTKMQDGEEERKAFEVEAHFIARRIHELKSEGYVLHNGKALRNKDIVILLRGAKERAGILLDALRAENIPAYADDTNGYFEASEIRMIFALLAILDNARQDTELAAVLTSPMIGLRMEEMAGLRIHTPYGSIYDMLTGATGCGIASELIEKAAHALERIRHFRHYALVYGVPELLWMLYRETGYYDYVGTLPGGVLRQANLRMLIDRAADFERTNERGLFHFLRYMNALKRRSTDLAVARTLGESEDVVRIMTIHRSKGLEFPVVFLANIAGAFNTQDTKGDLLYHAHEGIGLRVYENTSIGRQKYDTLSRLKVKAVIRREALAEEMRILYVAMTRAQEKLILTGTLNITRTGKDTLGQLRESCLKYAQTEDIAFPDSAILSAKSYLDWIALALMRHPDGVAIFGDTDKLVHRAPTNPKARFDVRIADENVRVSQREMQETMDSILSLVYVDQPLPAGKDAARVRNILNWTYDLHGTAQIHAKTSVTELKRRQVAEEEIFVPFLPALADAQNEAQEWEVPHFFHAAGQEDLTPMERGTAMHSVMQQLDLRDAADMSAIIRQVDELLKKGILTEAERKSVDVRKIRQFILSKLGQRMRAAKAVYRELPFGRLLPAQCYYEEATDASDQIFLQGIIDVLFEEENGDYILLDYKTDRNISAAAARARYQFQIDLYCDAVETILGKPVKECYIFLLDTGMEVKM